MLYVPPSSILKPETSENQNPPSPKLTNVLVESLNVTHENMIDFSQTEFAISLSKTCFLKSKREASQSIGGENLHFIII